MYGYIKHGFKLHHALTSPILMHTRHYTDAFWQSPTQEGRDCFDETAKCDKDEKVVFDWQTPKLMFTIARRSKCWSFVK